MAFVSQQSFTWYKLSEPYIVGTVFQVKLNYKVFFRLQQQNQCAKNDVPKSLKEFDSFHQNLEETILQVGFVWNIHPYIICSFFPIDRKELEMCGLCRWWTISWGNLAIFTASKLPTGNQILELPHLLTKTQTVQQSTRSIWPSTAVAWEKKRL